jgi:hypothetical protein
MPYFSGQGKVWVGARDGSGNPLGLVHVGNVPDLKISLSVEALDHQESTSGQRLVDLHLIKAKKAEFSCTLEELIATNLNLALYGEGAAQGTGTVSAEALPNPVTVGSLYLLAKQNVSSVVITDSTGSPKTLPSGQYTVNGKHGSIVINDATTGGAYVEPFKAAYSYGAAAVTAFFTQPQPERWIRFEGLNTANSNAEVVVDLYRVAIDPSKELSLITDDTTKFDLSGQVLMDTTKAAGGALGQFGRIVLL